VKGYVQYGDRFIPRDILYEIEHPESARRQRAKPVVVTRPLETLELFDIRLTVGRKPSLEDLYRDATA